MLAVDVPTHSGGKGKLRFFFFYRDFTANIELCFTFVVSELMHTSGLSSERIQGDWRAPRILMYVVGIKSN